MHKKFETEQKTESFQAREFVLLLEDSQYPQHIKFQLTQDRCGLLDPYNEGDQLKVYFDLRGREWNGKYFTNLNAWKLEAAQAESTDDFPVFNDEVFSDENEINSEDFNDLPF